MKTSASSLRSCTTIVSFLSTNGVVSVTYTTTLLTSQNLMVAGYLKDGA